jgi:indole-3-acetate monooxygenase
MTMGEAGQVFDVVQAARSVAGGLGGRSLEFEDARRMPEDVAQTLAAAGLFRMAVPRVYGGFECHPAEILEAIEVVSRADASAGWCLMIGATTGLTAAFLPPCHAREVFADPMTITGGVFAPMGRAEVDGEWLTVSGRWAWGSGSANCAWLLAGCVILDNGQPRKGANGAPETRMAFLPRSQVALDDTWFATGMKGTGSGDMVIEGARVPHDRTVSLANDRPHLDGALYTFPVFGLLAMGIAAVASGNARAAIDDLTALAGGKRPQGSSRTLAQRGSVQESVAKAEASLRAARAFLFEETHLAMADGERGDGLSVERRAGLRLAATHLTRTAADVCRTMYDLGGGSAVYTSSPLQRRFRDAHVATQHVMVSPSTLELCGRVLLGLETDVSLL